MAAALSASPWGPSHALERAHTHARARAHTHTGGARARKNTAFVGGACHSRCGDLWRLGSGLSYPRCRATRLWGPWQGVPLRRVGTPGCCQTLRKTPLPHTPTHPVWVTSTHVTRHKPLLPLWSLSHPHAPFCPSGGGQLVYPAPSHKQAQGQAPAPLPR